MSEDAPDRHEILVIGAGPAGLLAACELARYGVGPRIVERRLVPHRQARATAIQPAGLELLARAGVLAPFLERSVRVRRTRARTSTSAACRSGRPRQSSPST